MISTVNFSQSISKGVYKSKNGSVIKLNKNNTFYYEKNEIYTSDLVIEDLKEFSYGNFFLKNGYLLFNSSKNNNYIDSILNKSFILKEIDHNKSDSIIISINDLNPNITNLYMCGDDLYNEEDINDVTSCIKVYDKIKIKKNYSDNYYFLIYPNIDNHMIRSTNLNTIFFKTKFYKNSFHKDLLINLNFQPLYFSYIELQNDVVLIRNDKKLFFKGEEFNIE